MDTAGYEYLSNKGIEEKYKRKGKCNPQKCKAACCRFSVVGEAKEKPLRKYFKGMGYVIERIEGKDYIISRRACRYLNKKTYKCMRHNKRPVPCRQFPLSRDLVYLRVKKVCSYFFKSHKELKMGVDL